MLIVPFLKLAAVVVLVGDSMSKWLPNIAVAAASLYYLIDSAPVNVCFLLSAASKEPVGSAVGIHAHACYLLGDAHAAKFHEGLTSSFGLVQHVVSVEVSCAAMEMAHPGSSDLPAMDPDVFFNESLDFGREATNVLARFCTTIVEFGISTALTKVAID